MFAFLRALTGAIVAALSPRASLVAEMAKKIDPLQRELLALDTMGFEELVEKYREVFGRDTRTRNRAYLVHKIAWRLQERAQGGLSERAKARVAELAVTAPLRHVAQRTTEGADDGRDPRLPRAGTVLHREHNGKDHAVTVHEKDFEYRGKRYTSLSKIAKEITGTHWNGWLFFNLATRKRGAAAWATSRSTRRRWATASTSTPCRSSCGSSRG